MNKQTADSASQIHTSESVGIDPESLCSQVPLTPAPVPPDPDDLQSLWAMPSLVQTTPHMVNIPTSTRPPKDKFIRICPFQLPGGDSLADGRNCRGVLLFEYAYYGEYESRLHFVRPNTDVANLLANKGRLKFAILVLGMVHHGGLFIWVIKLPDGNYVMADQWASSRMVVAKRGESQWIKPFKSKSGNGYDYEEPLARYDEPDWSKIDFNQAIKAACKDRIIDSVEHEVVKEALGL